MATMPPIICDISTVQFVNFLKKVAAADPALAYLMEKEFKKMNGMPFVLFERKYLPTGRFLEMADRAEKTRGLYGKILLLNYENTNRFVYVFIESNTSRLSPFII